MSRLGQAVLLLIQALALLCASALLATELFAQQSSASADKVFKGDARCTRCHDGEDGSPVLEIAKSKHGGSAKISGMTCTSCHGESEAHVNKPANATERPKPDIHFGKGKHATPAAVREQSCMSCHGSDRNLAFWQSGRHKTNDVACDSCHLVHPAKTPPLRKDNPTVSPFVTTERQLQYETCTTCHKQIRSQLLKPSHHPIIEGKLACSDCHNPHGALSKAMVKAESIPQLCTSCHAEKRGPFVWGHPPVEENCLACHNSHGANHARLLQQKSPNLCQDCHDASRHPGTIYDATSGNWGQTNITPNTRLIARGCVNCHSQVHGSNAPAMRGKFFLR